MFTFAVTYALVWLALAGYVGWMSSRQRRLIAQFACLQQQYFEAEVSETDEHLSLQKAA